jgi:hypothetical protein
VRTPQLINLSVQNTGASDWVEVPQAQATTFQVLPLSQPATGLRLTLDVPLPGQLVVTAIDPASGMTAALPAVFGGQEGPATGFHRIDSINAQTRPPRWSVTIVPPDAFGTLRTFQINIAHRDGNAQSQPLIVTLDGAKQS